jgi:hypothetical protein
VGKFSFVRKQPEVAKWRTAIDLGSITLVANNAGSTPAFRNNYASTLIGIARKLKIFCVSIFTVGRVGSNPT